ncbi:MAG: hypothetical protein RLZZ628_3738 [Bacteroidota bacterium]|jgi:tellurium resistance protein TerD
MPPLQLRKVNAGEKINLSKSNPGLKKVKIGLSWDMKSGIYADLDASMLILDAQGKMIAEDSIAFYNKPEHYNGLVKHSGDNRTGFGDGDDEKIIVELDRLPDEAKMLMAVITIYDDNLLRGRGTPPVNFGKVQNASVRLYDNATGQALYQFDLTADAATATSVEMACLYRRENDWEFTALGKIAGTSPNGLEDIIAKYANS